MSKPELYIDFASSASEHRRLHGGGRGQPIAKAVGLKTYGLPLTIIDATAGLGQDAFVLACLGCNVTLIERSPLIANLLQDALQRAAAVADLKPITDLMHIINADAKRILASLPPAAFPDVVYLDPMFPLRNKSALVKQEMRLLKEIVGDDPDADALLTAARQVALRRVVVKRPRIAPYLDNITPHSSQIGKANRFDIYMPL
jgi:16S rRNA (guanine1516-N2)-methyltransferase